MRQPHPTLLLVVVPALVAGPSCEARPAVGQVTPVLERYDLGAPAGRFEMPGRLDEISGLAMDGEGRLFAHDDERARIHEIDVRTGEVGRPFSLRGDVRGDFEGIAIAGERFFMITSQGLLYEFREGTEGAEVAYRVTDTGLGASCEVEGLDHDPADDVLYLGCKRTSPDQGMIVVHRLPLDPARARLDPLHVARSQLAAFGLDDDFQPSAVLVTPAGTLLVASAVGEMLIEVDVAGRVLAGVELDRDRHPQPEGLTIGPDGALYVSDEQNDQDAQVTIYRPLRGGGGGA
jgi:uncharacterized protein YjiK